MVVGFCVIIVPTRLSSTVLLLIIERKLEVEECYVMSILHQLLLIVRLLVIKLRRGEVSILKTTLHQLLSILSFGQIARRKFILG